MVSRILKKYLARARRASRAGVRAVPSILVAACLAAEVALTAPSAPWLAGVARPLILTAVVGLAMIAVAISAWWSMALRRETAGLRFVAAVPVVLSVALAVVLMLEAHRHAGARLIGTGG